MRVTAQETVVRYTTLNDAQDINSGLAPGGTEIWYLKDAFFGVYPTQLMNRFSYPDQLPESHIQLGSIAESDPERVFGLLQGETWSPQGEANQLIGSLRLGHTSMSVGDAIVVGGKVYLVDGSGFIEAASKNPLRVEALV